MIMHRPLFFISQFLNGLNELIGSDFYLPQDLSNERARQVSPRMPGQCRGSSIGMSIKNVAAFLSDSHKTHLEKYFLHGPEIHHRETSHIAISICCNPTKRGKSGSSYPYSSRQSSMPSLRFRCSSSRVSAWVWAPGMPGTLPTYKFVPSSNSI